MTDETPAPPRGKIFWVRAGEHHVCWRHSELQEGYGYQRLGEYRRDREHGVYRALKHVANSALPVPHVFDNEEEAQRWIES